MNQLSELRKELTAREKYVSTLDGDTPMYIRKRITRLKNLIKKLEISPR